MYVKFIVLDGFKSYRDSTRIGPFDPHFNAITGLNGSGKSNILDAICFVLGITSMSVVRCKNLADCIYMGHGESLTKATVSIILDNTDKSRSPPGQQNYDEIIVSRTVQKGGDCRYHINRIGAPKRAVTDLFESVQLNVNNPNFMIMQGKITKVVNMKPKELLHMIEETVGATLYQAKREKATAELHNKQQTIESINGLIMDHIKPSLDKQRKAHEMIQEFNIQMREKNDLAINYAVAHYFDLQNKGKRAKQELEKILEQDQKDDELAEEYKVEIKRLKHREEQMKKENTSRFKEKVDEAEKSLKDQKKVLHAKETDVKTAKESLDKAKKAVKEAEKTKLVEEKQVEDFRKKSATSVAEFEELQNKKLNAEQELEKAREQENQLRSGKLLDEEGKSMDVEQELNRISTELATLKPEVEDGRQRMKENTGKLANLEHQLKQTPSDDQVEKEFKQKQQICENLKREAAKRNINAEESVVDVRNKLADCRKRYDVCTREKDSITRRNHYLSFNYRKDKVGTEGVLGCVYEHLTINGVEEWGNALEVALGGFVGQIIVENDTIGKALVKVGEMSRRTYIHPLNTFRSSYRPPRVNQRTLDQEFGPGNAIFAISLLQFDRKLQPLVEHNIGSKVLCKTMDIARKVAFTMGLPSYTVAGDFVDPGGIMQGGSRSGLGQTIKDCVTLSRLSYDLRQLGHDMQVLNQQLSVAQQNEQFIAELEKAKREYHNADQMRKMTKYSQIKEEIDTLKQKIQEDGTKLKELQEKYTKLEKSKTQLQRKADEVESHREKQMRDISNRIKKFEKELETIIKKFEDRKKYFNEIEVDLNSKMEFLNGCQKDIDDAIANVNHCEQKLEKAQKEVQTFMEHFQIYQKAYDDAVAESNEWHEEAKHVQEQIKALDKKKETAELNKMKRNNQRTNYQDYVQGAEAEIESLKERFPSIPWSTQKAPTDGKGAGALKKELDVITKKLEDMQQRLDHEAAAALQNTKREFDTSRDKMNMILKNKQGLVKAIETLDEAKKQKVRAAYDDVNAKFNDMMQTLLPEAGARLVEVVPGTLAEGVNIHVKLGGVWKESLTELSGGQRSLVALSLVLSLCMYNPAPFYILDEVDAALDLSHTQNIGVVIQRQFKGTQFICVSLKDGMFSNANVLFTAKHEGGRSVVTRSAKINRAMPPPSTDDRHKKAKSKK